MTSLLIALALIASPADELPGWAEHADAADWHETFDAALTLLDLRGSSRPWYSGKGSLRWLADHHRTVYREMLTCPPLGCAALFPSRFSLKCARYHNELYADQLEDRRAVDVLRRDRIDAALTETRALHAIYWQAETMADSKSCPLARRRGLKALLELLGPAAFYRGQLPPPLPLHLLPEG